MWFISGLSLGQLWVITVLSMLIMGVSRPANAMQVRDNPGMALFGKGHFMYLNRPKGFPYLSTNAIDLALSSGLGPRLN